MLSFIKKIFYKNFYRKKVCPFCNSIYYSTNLICPKCTKIFAISEKQEFCLICGKFILTNSNKIMLKNKNGSPIICESCNLKKPPFTIARGFGIYEGILKENIYKFKYHGKRSLAPVMARLMVEKASACLEFSSLDCVVPVPLAEERLKNRRYNQAYILAKEISLIIKKPLIHNNLIRIINTPAQSKLTKDAREENLREAFQVLQGHEFVNKNILLVDDIVTTGSTVAECSRILKRNGAGTIMVLTLITGKNRGVGELS